MFHLSFPHPVLSVVNLAMGSGTVAFVASKIAPGTDPNLAAVATMMGAVATIFSAWVAYRHPLRTARRRKRKPYRVPKIFGAMRKRPNRDA